MIQDYIAGEELKKGEAVYLKSGRAYKALHAEVPYSDPEIKVAERLRIDVTCFGDATGQFIYAVDEAVQAVEDFSDAWYTIVKVICSHCGQYGERRSACNHCGAPIHG